MMIRVKPANSPLKSISEESEERQLSKNVEKASDMYDPLTKFLKLCGSYSSRSIKTGKLMCSGHFVYCLVIQLIVLVTCLKYFNVFRSNSNPVYKTTGLIGFLYFYVTVIVFSIVCFYSNFRFLAPFYTEVDRYGAKHGIDLDISKIRKMLSRIVGGISTFLVISVLGGTVWMIYYIKGKNLLITSSLTPFDEEEGIVLIIAGLVMGVCTLFYHLIFDSNILFLLTNVHILKHEFQHVRKKIQNIINNNQLENIEHLRLQHEHITHLVETGNQMFRHVAGITYAYGIPIVCLMLYGMMTKSLDIADLIPMATALALSVIGMFIITFSGANLNEAVSFDVYQYMSSL